MRRAGRCEEARTTLPRGPCGLPTETHARAAAGWIPVLAPAGLQSRALRAERGALERRVRLARVRARLPPSPSPLPPP